MNLFHSLPREKKLSTIINIFMIFLVVLSITLTVIESIPSIMTPDLARLFLSAHTVVLIAFLAEFLYRFWRAPDTDGRLTPMHARIRFLCRPLTFIDLIVIAPLFVMLWTHNLHDADFVVLRILRFTSMFNIFRFYRNSHIIQMMQKIGRTVWYEIIVFFLIAAQIIVIAGMIFYAFEHGVNPGITNILDGIWWAIVTMTTIGYGDIYPHTALGRVIASIVGILGIGFIALPTSILATGFMRVLREQREIESITDDIEEISEDTDDLNKRLTRIERLLTEKLK